jgi:hypothetical protein
MIRLDGRKKPSHSVIPHAPPPPPPGPVEMLEIGWESVYALCDGKSTKIRVLEAIIEHNGANRPSGEILKIAYCRVPDKAAILKGGVYDATKFRDAVMFGIIGGGILGEQDGTVALFKRHGIELFKDSSFSNHEANAKAVADTVVAIGTVEEATAAARRLW